MEAVAGLFVPRQRRVSCLTPAVLAGRASHRSPASVRVFNRSSRVAPATSNPIGHPDRPRSGGKRR
ncbi:MAG: hypothetical protein AVDCRST_MAG73-295 [uncultured Thermomicrobiales bacterium]|uniref:Uncharacterized protein n=1 Tax=uncultured Thermomicrobiales bacterium TaxID=1645740 RepID=A0A6J4TK05_9BACT|nr:MAG: hypothetical protein AVDCRST_MAG73-295 [uncultured Thermomicrobiales bacterium]